MRWEDERYVRLYTRDTATWKLLPWQGRALLPLLLRKADRAGLVDVEGDRVEGVAALVDLPMEVVEVGLVAMLKRGVVEQRGETFVFPKFIEAQEANMGGTARQRECRERQRDLVRAGLAPDQRRPVVYFVQGENGGPIKIGRTDDLAKRLVGLSTSSPERLVVLAAVPGTAADERAVHDHFAAARHKGEWFHPTPGLMAFAAALTADATAISRVTSYDPSPVTKRDTSPNVTGNGTFGVTPSRTVPIRAEPEEGEGEPPTPSGAPRCPTVESAGLPPGVPDADEVKTILFAGGGQNIDRRVTGGVDLHWLRAVRELRYPRIAWERLAAQIAADLSVLWPSEFMQRRIRESGGRVTLKFLLGAKVAEAPPDACGFDCAPLQEAIGNSRAAAMQREVRRAG